MFATYDDVLHWVRSVAYEISFMTVIMSSDTNNDIRGKTSFVLIDCERSGQYMTKKKDLVRTVNDNRKCRCPFKLRAKPIVGGEG